MLTMDRRILRALSATLDAAALGDVGGVQYWATTLADAAHDAAAPSRRQADQENADEGTTKGANATDGKNDHR